MKITDQQLEVLEKLGQEALEDPGIKKIRIEGTINALIDEVRRVHKTGDEFSKSLVWGMLESVPYDLPYFQYLSKVRNGRPTEP